MTYKKIEYPCQYKLLSQDVSTSHTSKCTEFAGGVYPLDTLARTVYGLRIYDEESKCKDCDKRKERE